MGELKNKQNETGIDLIKVMAMYFVVSLHYFLYNGYYYIEDKSPEILFHVSMRTLFFQCVPLFLMITGYLGRKRTFGRKHFVKAIPVLLSYIAVCAIVIAWKVLYLKEQWGFWVWAKSVWTFNQPSYAWYVNMYLTLMIFIPLINGAYNSLKSRRHKFIAVVLTVALTTLAGTVNKIHLPESSGITSIGLPLSFFSGLWPVAYYAVGMYIGEFRPKYPKYMTLTLAALFCFTAAIANYSTVTTNYYSGYNVENNEIINVIISGLIFLALYDVEIKNKYVKKGLSALAKLSMITYLVSYMTDNMIYKHFAGEFTGYGAYVPMYFKIVPMNFAITVIISGGVYLLIKPVSDKIMKVMSK